MGSGKDERRAQRGAKVLVVDADRQFVDYVPPAWARRWLKHGHVQVFRKNPFTVMLPPGQRELPRSARKKYMNQPNGGYGQLSQQQRNPLGHGGTGQGVRWLDYFREERDVWVQNTSATQLSLDIEVAPGQTQGLRVPISPDPVCLTDEYPWETLKKSTNFRRMAQKRDKRTGQPIMRLMTDEDVEAYFAAKAFKIGAVIRDQNGQVVTGADGKAIPDLDAARAAALSNFQRLTNMQSVEQVNAEGAQHFAPPKSAQELIAMDQAQRGIVQGQHALAMSGVFDAAGAQTAMGQRQAYMQQMGQAAGYANLGQQPVQMESIINPRVLQLCQEVSPQIPEGARKPAPEFFDELQQLEASLTIDDFQYIQAHGTYKTVKAWGGKRALEKEQTLVGGAGLDDNLSMPGTTLAGYQAVGAAQAGGLFVDAGANPNIVHPGAGAGAGMGMGMGGPQQWVHNPAIPTVGAHYGPDGSPLGAPTGFATPVKPTVIKADGQ